MFLEVRKMFVLVIGVVFVVLAALLSAGAAFAFVWFGDALWEICYYLRISQPAGIAIVCALAVVVFVFISFPGFALMALGRSQSLLRKIKDRQELIQEEIGNLKPFLD